MGDVGRILLVGGLLLAACSNDPDAAGEPCSPEEGCAGDATCLIDRCVYDGHVPQGKACSQHRQCDEGLVCRSFSCQPGCADVYTTHECDLGSFCKPDVTAAAGDCTPSECDPLLEGQCGPDLSCVGVAPDIGVCGHRCTYGFLGGSYSDSCADEPDQPHGCQPIGQASSSVCLPTSGTTGLGAHEPGCDTLTNPCQDGLICVNIVCRTLCQASAPGVCDTGEICAPLAPANQLHYCRAP